MLNTCQMPTYSSRQAKVCKFKDTSIGQENIAQLDVSMDNMMRMQVPNTFQELLRETFAIGFGEGRTHRVNKGGNVLQ